MPDLTSIRAAADHFGVPISTLHYWERQGMLSPIRSGGARWYDADQLYRIALIKLWRQEALLSIGAIGTVLTLAAEERRAVLVERIAEIRAQREELTRAEAYLHTLLACEETHTPEHCPHFRAAVTIPTDSTTAAEQPV